MKRLVACLMGICLCVPAHAQWKNLFKLRKSAPKTALTARVQAQLGRSALLPAAQVRRLVAAGQVSARMVPSVLAAPEAAQLVRNEFLTLSAHKTIQILPEQSSQALDLLRRNILARSSRLDMLPEISVSPLDPRGEPARLALEALGDAYGVGWYGTLQDGAALIKLYRTLGAGELEPLAFTASARALLALNDIGRLETLLAFAPRTEAYESFVQFLQQENYAVRIPAKTEAVRPVNVLPFKGPMELVSRPGLSLFDFSSNATAEYLVTASRLRATRASAAQAKTPAPQAQSAAVQTPSLQNVKIDLSAPALELGETALPTSSATPTFEENIRPNPITKRFPSGLQDEEQVIKDWMEYYRNGYFQPR
ncbi:MAG: hypothetical protein PUC11_00930, partial [Elusimicrobia bacterium]|nr:hypothetical protein [Elusimicrobiota bacterium]